MYTHTTNCSGNSAPFLAFASLRYVRAREKNGAKLTLISRPYSDSPLLSPTFSISSPSPPRSPSHPFSLSSPLLRTVGIWMLGESPAAATASSAAPKGGAPKKRGNYNCGRCGLPKKGHVCPSGNGHGLPPRSDHRLRRALSFEEDRTPAAVAAAPGMEEEEEEEEVAETTAADYEEVEVGGGVLPVSCLAEVLRRLSPKELMGTAAVCRGWRECVKRVWRSAEELRLRVSPRSQIGFVGSVLHKCAGLARLTLRIERLGLFLRSREEEQGGSRAWLVELKRTNF